MAATIAPIAPVANSGQEIGPTATAQLSLSTSLASGQVRTATEGANAVSEATQAEGSSPAAEQSSSATTSTSDQSASATWKELLASMGMNTRESTAAKSMYGNHEAVVTVQVVATVAGSVLPLVASTKEIDRPARSVPSSTTLHDVSLSSPSKSTKKTSPSTKEAADALRQVQIANPPTVSNDAAQSQAASLATAFTVAPVTATPSSDAADKMSASPRKSVIAGDAQGTPANAAFITIAASKTGAIFKLANAQATTPSLQSAHRLEQSAPTPTPSATQSVEAISDAAQHSSSAATSASGDAEDTAGTQTISNAPSALAAMGSQGLISKPVLAAPTSSTYSSTNVPSSSSVVPAQTGTRSAGLTVDAAFDADTTTAGAAITPALSPTGKATTALTARTNSERTNSMQAVHLTNAAPGSIQQEGSTTGVVRDAGANSAPFATDTDGATTSPASDTGASAAHATFTALDSGSLSNTPTWIHANARSAEAGYQDPTLGWVGVRAQQDARGVHAIVLPVSQDAAQELGTHLAGLNMHLAEHNTPVSSVSVASPEGASTGLAMGPDRQSRSGQHHGQDAFDGTATGSMLPASAINAGASDRVSSWNIEPPSTGPDGSGGTYISVMA